MDKNAIWKWLVLVMLAVFSLGIVFIGDIRLGLDLKGGTSFTVRIDESEVRELVEQEKAFQGKPAVEIDSEVRRRMNDAQERALEVLRNRVDNLGIAEPMLYPAQDGRIIIQLPGVDTNKLREAEESIRSVAFLEFRVVHERNLELVNKLFEANQAPEGYIVSRARPRFYERDPQVPDAAMDKAYRERLRRFGIQSAQFEFMLEKDDDKGVTYYRPLYVQKLREKLSGAHLKDAMVDFGIAGQPAVALEFNTEGAKLFGAITSDYAPGGAKNSDANTGRQLAIVLDGTVYSAPAVREPIYGGRAQITGSFTREQANLLANILRAGALPAPVSIIERRFVAPSLGTDSIASGRNAVLIGAAAVVLFMGAYYLLCGLVADFALILNIVLLPLGMVFTAGILSIFARDSGGSLIRLPVLTLPGIAGIGLAIGMAVDANVLIFERMREEFAAGKSVTGAIKAGFDRAFTAILDSNITTVLTAVILFIFGAGPIRGYAVTLVAGLLVNMYTAVFVARLVFDGMSAHARTPVRFKMMSVIKKTPTFDIMRWRTPVMAASILIIVASWIVMGVNYRSKPARVFGVDFLGGSSVSLSCDTKPNVDEIRQALDQAGLESAIQYQTDMETTKGDILQVNTTFGLGKKVAEVLPARFPEANFKLVQEDDIGPQIGSELRGKAAWAMLWALVAIVIYISWRFEFGFALGAVLALFHDVLFTVGVVHLMGRPFNLPMIAAILTVIGYSVNDTIVIFDRIRENLRLVPGGKFYDLCNLSLNQTLARTILTGLCTIMTVVAMLVFGGGAIFDFALVLLIGMLVGTYSSIYIATPVTFQWYRAKTPDLGKGSK